MYKSIILLLVLSLSMSCNEEKQSAAEQQVSSKPENPAEEKVIYYTCPMEEHKHIHNAEPGNCSECDMDLVAGVITSEEKMEFYGCPMLIHSHVRQQQAGTCEECGMTLKPMRLVKDKTM